MNLTMESRCANCGKTAKVGEEFIAYETSLGMIHFCSEECERKYALTIKKEEEGK